MSELKTLLIAIPEGYRYIELTLPEEVLNLITPCGKYCNLRTFKQIPTGLHSEYTSVIIDEEINVSN